jgi:hypothetical protein
MITSGSSHGAARVLLRTIRVYDRSDARRLCSPMLEELAELAELAELHAAGVNTDAELEAKRDAILAAGATAGTGPTAEAERQSL